MRCSSAILLLALSFWFIETNYFGWNFLPSSPEELICDGLVLVMWCIAIAVREKR